MSFVVLGPSGRRSVVKTSPMMKFAQVLKCAAEKLNLGVEGDVLVEYCLKHRGKQIDLSLSVRFANIPNNASLDLEKKPAEEVGSSSVKVVLQFLNGQRSKPVEVPSSTSIWGILEVTEKEPDVWYSGKLTHPSESSFNCESSEGGFDSGKALVPECVYMREQFTTLSALVSTSLKDLGLLSGSALFRVTHKRSEVGVEEVRNAVDAIKAEMERERKAVKLSRETEGGRGSSSTKDANSSMQKLEGKMPCCVPSSSREPCGKDSPATLSTTLPSFPQPTSSIFDNQSSSHHVSHVDRPAVRSTFGQPPNASSQPDFSDFKFPDKPIVEADMMQVDNEQSDVELANPLTDVSVRVFDRTTAPHVPEAELDMDENTFRVTERDVRIMMESARSELSKLQNAPLMTEAMRKTRDREKYDKYGRCKVKIMLENNADLCLELSLEASTLQLYGCVKECLAERDTSFELYIAPPKRVIPKSKERTLLDEGLVPAAILHISSLEGNKLTLLHELEAKKECYESLPPPVTGYQEQSCSDGRTEEHHVLELEERHREQLRLQRNMEVAEARGGQPESSHSSGRKVPKWFKMNKK